MINTQWLEHAVKIAIFSPYVKGEGAGVSILFAAPPEHGKSEIIKLFKDVSSVKYTSDFNTYILADYINDYRADKKKTLMFPDFLKVTKKRYSTAATALMNLAGLKEEGLTGKQPSGIDIPAKEPVFANVVTAITESELKDKRMKWGRTGGLSRDLPLTFSYSKETAQQIREYIKDRMYLKEQKEYTTLEMPKKPIDVSLPKKEANEIEKISNTVKVSLERVNYTGFRIQRHLQTLAMANALSAGSTIVTSRDVEVVKNISQFANFEYTEI